MQLSNLSDAAGSADRDILHQPEERQIAVVSLDAIEAHSSLSLERRLKYLRVLERKVLWLATWTIHNANNLRPKRDGLKVGGHQASCASVTTLMTALYFDALRAQDRVAVKPHASPAYHAVQYLRGRQNRTNLERFRALGGAQSYPSRTKDVDDVDFSTGSVGLGVAMTSFAGLVQDYVRARGLVSGENPPGRMIALLGDAELDEGNVFEALFEGWKHGIRNVWWIIDYNRQSLDRVTEDRLVERIEPIFVDMGWRVSVLKYGKQLEQAFRRRGGEALRCWIDACSNRQYSQLTYKGGSAWREHLKKDLGDTSGIRELLDEHDDESLQHLMTNLAGHDMQSVVEAFEGVQDSQPTCFLAYTIKGYGLPFAGHKDNHASLMTSAQIDLLKRRMGIEDGKEWERFAGLDVPEEDLEAFIHSVPFQRRTAGRAVSSPIEIPPRIQPPVTERMSTQAGFGRILTEIARTFPSLADRIVTTSPDVTVSTNLGGWVNARGVFDYRESAALEYDDSKSAQKWALSPRGQHIELGIAENNLFILLAALGLSDPLFGVRLLPIGTVYDPFICRGLDALNYACYQNARFMLAGTPSGITLGPEGAAHQSVYTPLIGMGQPKLTMYEPAYVDELGEIVRWAFEYIQADEGGAVYLRLSTRPIEQRHREMTDDLSRAVLSGGYWFVEPASDTELAVVCCGAVIPEAIKAHALVSEDIPGAGLLVVTSADVLHRGWLQASRSSADSHIEQLLRRLPQEARLVSVLDGHPATLSWLGAVCGHRIAALGTEKFGQSGDLPDLYRTYHLDADAILDAAARGCLAALD